MSPTTVRRRDHDDFDSAPSQSTSTDPCKRAEPFDPDLVVEPSPLDGFSLTVTRSTIALGDDLLVTLRNETEEERITGNRRKIDLQYRTSTGWQSVFHRLPHTGWTDEGISHGPGDGFEWSFTMSVDGLESIVPDSRYLICSPLETGRYRFVFWGLTTAAERESNFETEYAIGAEFSVTDSTTE